MNDKINCKNCPVYKDCKDDAVSWFFLFVGLVATLAVRIVNVVMDISFYWAKFSWYVGIAGFFVYFLYKFNQDFQTRKQLLQLKIREKIIHRQALEEDDYSFLKAALCRLSSKKDTINYFFIFVTSGLALIFAIYQDFIRK